MRTADEKYATLKYGPKPEEAYWGTNFWVTLADAKADMQDGIRDGAGSVYIVAAVPDGAGWVRADADVEIDMYLRPE